MCPLPDLLCCSAEFVDDGERHRCVNPPKRYVIGRAELKAHPEPGFECQCKREDGRRLLRKHRHQDERGCMKREDVQAFKAKHGIKSDDLARSLMFLEAFAPIPESEIPGERPR